MTLHYLVDTDWAIHYLHGQALSQIRIFDAKSETPVFENQWLVNLKIPVSGNLRQNPAERPACDGFRPPVAACLRLCSLLVQPGHLSVPVLRNLVHVFHHSQASPVRASNLRYRHVIGDVQQVDALVS
jgi:hypothetical protein